MPKFSILIPHLHNAVGIRALRVCLDTIVKNTVNEYELIIQAQSGDNAYPLWNMMARMATTEWLIFTVTDQFVPPHWDIPLWDARERDTLVISCMIESGFSEVSNQNIEKNFGMSPETYKENDFNAFAASTPPIPAGEAWIMPWLIHRQTFLDFGGFDLDPTISDIYFFQRWRDAGRRWVRVPSYSYHLQRWSVTGAER